MRYDIRKAESSREVQEAGFRSLSAAMRLSELQATSNEQCLDMLFVAATNQELESETQALQIIADSPSEKVAFDPNSSSQVWRRPKHSKRKQQENTYDSGLAMIRYYSTDQVNILADESRNKRRIPARRNRYDFRIAQWLLSWAFSWHSIGTYSNWQYNFLTFRYISSDSLVKDFCKEGDL